MNKGKKWFRALFKRRVQVVMLLILQILLIAFLIINGSNYLIINIGLVVISILVALHVVAKDDKSEYKLTWVFLILLFPLFGGLFYLLFKFQSSTRKFTKRLDKFSDENLEPNYFTNTMYCDNPLVRYLTCYNKFPLYDCTKTTYLENGQLFYENLLEELEKAKKYIFLEYYIIAQGKMWNSIFEILKRKVEEGVKVRIIYDDMGCLLLLPNKFDKYLKQYGIECVVFNPFRPLLATIQNNRDHRKIAVIDGMVAFTGGINLSDEYINPHCRLGYWKDAGIKLEGKATWTFTTMFLKMWEISCNKKENYYDYFPWKKKKCNISTDGYVQPYADSPLDGENIIEHIYLYIISHAKKYVYINTPYLIIDDNIMQALKMAAKSGVDVRIVVPHKWDKKLVHFTTRSYYQTLIKAGVKIYEYSLGFIHSKVIVSDNNIATVGTANLDFRSLYLNFECGSCIYDAKCIMDIKKDFLSTVDVSLEMTLEDCKTNYFIRILQAICRLFAPLM